MYPRSRALARLSVVSFLIAVLANIGCSRKNEQPAPAPESGATQSDSLTLTNATDEQLRSIAERKDLRTVSIEGASITNAGLTPLAGLPALESVSLSCAKSTLECVKHLKDAKMLRSLSLDFRAAGPRSHSAGSFALGQLADLPIAKLELRAHTIASGYLAPLSNYQSLEELVLECAEFYDSPLISDVKSLRHLKRLTVIVGSGGTGTLPAHLGQLESVQWMKLSFGMEEGDLLALAGCKSLRALDLRGAKVSDFAIAKLRSARPDLSIER